MPASPLASCMEAQLMMRKTYRALLGGAAAALILGAFGSLPAAAQNSYPDGQVNCGAVARMPMGSWHVMSPVTISPDGRTMTLAPGQTFAPNQMYGGVEVSAVLDRNCGNP